MSNLSLLRGKKILITSHSYADFGGAELNAVELAEQLIDFGMEPFFFSYDIDGPLRDYIEKKFQTTVLSDRINKFADNDSVEEMDVTRFDINTFDYIWIGGNTIPISILKQIKSAEKMPKFIFIHMSSLISFPLDAPLMPDFEKEIASKILSVGQRATVDNIKRILGDETPVDTWYNPVPKDFKYLDSRTGILKRIAVISSSHPSNEIIEIKKAIEGRGIKIDYIGKFNDNVKVVDAQFYDKYDLIIGIGKNAKYSLVSGVPIYVYGRFGGPGYLTGNEKISEAYNLSGRGFGEKDAGTIVDEIITGYSSALSYHERHRNDFIEKFSIDKVAGDLFIDLEQKSEKKVSFTDQYINWLVSMQINLMQRHMRTAWLRKAEARVKSLEKQITDQTTTIAMFKRDTDILKAKRNELKQELSGVYQSKSWKITMPFRLMSLSLRNFKNKVAKK